MKKLRFVLPIISLTFSLLLSSCGPQNNDSFLNISAEDAFKIGKELNNNEITNEKYIISGTIESIQIPYNETNGSTYFTFVGGLAVSNATCLTELGNKISIGAEATVKGNIRKYFETVEVISATLTYVSGEDNDETIKNVHITAINDFHGAIYEEGRRMGLDKVGTYLKMQSDKPNTLVISQGDDWQGSIYSNYNHGKLINDVYAYVHMDARTVGNHDFDWGVEILKENTAREYNGYVTPVLAANVYDYNFANKKEGNIQQREIGQPTVTYTLENDVKVGIVGVIGQDQITSITSSYTMDICFKDHIKTIKEEATKLRNDGCDIVIATVHAGQESVLNNDLSDYVDLVVCGHTHRYEYSEENNVNFVQFGCYGQYIGDIDLKYNVASKKVISTTVEIVDSSNIDKKINSLDLEIVNLINEYKMECDEEASVILANNVTDWFQSGEEAANLMCKAIYEQSVIEGHEDVILSYINTARHYLPKGSWTYADLYESFPFDNTVYIVEVSGYDVLNEIKNWNNVYFSPTFDKKINRNQKYKIAVLDYLLYHTNRYRYYDYFESFNGVANVHLSDNYRVILRNWLINNGYNKGKNLNPNNYKSSLDSYNRNLLNEIW